MLSVVEFNTDFFNAKRITNINEVKAVLKDLYKSFTIVINDHNDNGLYYETTIVANLVLARSVNYNHKVCCKLNHTFTILNYDPKPFIVQATDM